MTNQQYIYSDTDFWEKWEQLMVEVEKYQTKQNVDFNRTSYNNALAVAILSYRGLTRSQIAALKNQDVTPDGITGYDVTFDDKSLQTLLDFKRYTDKNQQYIWTGRNTEIKEQTLSDFFSKRRMGDSDLAPLFNLGTLNDAYKFRKLTEFCKDNGIVITGFTRSELKPLHPYYPEMCKIVGVGYIKDNKTPLLKVLRKYYEGYLIPLEAKPEVAQDTGADQNQQLFKKALLEKIAVMESTLAEIKAMAELLG